MSSSKPLGDLDTSPFPENFEKKQYRRGTKIHPVPDDHLRTMPRCVQGGTPFTRVKDPVDVKRLEARVNAEHEKIYAEDFPRVKEESFRTRDGRVVAVHHVFVLDRDQICAIASLSPKKRGDVTRFQLCSFRQSGKFTGDRNPIWELGGTPSSSYLWFRFYRPQGDIVTKIWNNIPGPNSIGRFELDPKNAITDDTEDNDVEMAHAPPLKRAAAIAPKRKGSHTRDEEDDGNSAGVDVGEDEAAFWGTDRESSHNEDTAGEEDEEDHEEANFKFGLHLYRAVPQVVDNILSLKPRRMLSAQSALIGAENLIRAVHDGPHNNAGSRIKLNDRRVHDIAEWVISQTNADEIIGPNGTATRKKFVLSILASFSVASASVHNRAVGLGVVQDGHQSLSLVPRIRAGAWFRVFLAREKRSHLGCEDDCKCPQIAWAIMYHLGAMIIPPVAQQPHQDEGGTGLDKARRALDNAMSQGVGAPKQDRLIMERAVDYVVAADAVRGVPGHWGVSYPPTAHSDLVSFYAMKCLTLAPVRCNINDSGFWAHFDDLNSSVASCYRAHPESPQRICALLAEAPHVKLATSSADVFRVARFFCSVLEEQLGEIAYAAEKALGHSR